MKAEKEHTVALSDEAVTVLRAQAGTTGLIFPAPRGGVLSDMTLTALLRRMSDSREAQGNGRWTDKAGNNITVHGFRSTFRDWAGAKTHHSREVIEHALAHKLKDKAEAAYARDTLLEKRQHLMADWAKFCTTAPVAGNNVIALERIA
jgi:integrase